MAVAGPDPPSPGRRRSVRFPAMTSLRATPATGLRYTGRSTDPHVLAVDLGTGGPKVALLSATGRITAHAFQCGRN